MGKLEYKIDEVMLNRIRILGEKYDAAAKSSAIEAIRNPSKENMESAKGYVARADTSNKITDDVIKIITGKR